MYHLRQGQSRRTEDDRLPAHQLFNVGTEVPEVDHPGDARNARGVVIARDGDGLGDGVHHPIDDTTHSQRLGQNS